jgi:hypothetical protein
MRPHVLLELGEELCGFDQGESQVLDPLAVFLQYRSVVDCVRSIILCTNDHLNLPSHVLLPPF